MLSGDVDLYVSETWEQRPILQQNQVSSYRIRSSSVGAEDLTITHSQLVDICSGRSYCYVIVGVLGTFYDGQNSHTPSEYRIMQTVGVTTITLASGVAVRGHVDSGFTVFYMYTVTNTSYDVIFSVTSFSGDPDMYISVWPNTYPSGSNYTWVTVCKFCV